MNSTYPQRWPSRIYSPQSTRLQARLSAASADGRGVLFGFLPAGFPDPDGFRAVVGAAFAAGLDAMEVGMPGPASALDGPRIQAANAVATDHVATVRDALVLAAAARGHADDPIVALALAHVVESLGPDTFLRTLVDADVDACLLPELPMRDQLALAPRASALGVEPVLFLYRQEDLALVARCELPRPVIYLQSADLKTGDAFNPAKAAERLGELRAAMGGREYRVVVGFGVSGAAEVGHLVRAGADGAVIGTRLVTAAAEGSAATHSFVAEVMSAALARPADPAVRTA